MMLKHLGSGYLLKEIEDSHVAISEAYQFFHPSP